jgi:hypothetical protein
MLLMRWQSLVIVFSILNQSGCGPHGLKLRTCVAFGVAFVAVFDLPAEFLLESGCGHHCCSRRREQDGSEPVTG